MLIQLTYITHSIYVMSMMGGVDVVRFLRKNVNKEASVNSRHRLFASKVNIEVGWDVIVIHSPPSGGIVQCGHSQEGLAE